MQKIVVYRAKGNDWQMCRGGDKRSPFYTTTQRPRLFTDGRQARGWMRTCQTWASNKLGWTDAVWDVVPLDVFKAFA